MGLLRNLNFRRHTRTLRTLDFENASPSRASDGGGLGGRHSDALYEGTTRVPRPDDPDGSEGPIHHPVPEEKPDPAAQWDDVRGCWIKWDAEAGDWVDLPTASGVPADEGSAGEGPADAGSDDAGEGRGIHPE